MSHSTLTGKLTGTLKLILFVALLATCAPLATAQEVTGSIRGTVKDSTGAVVQGATVTATSPSLVRPIEVTTDENGAYFFGRLPSGIYSISAGQTGFSTVKQDNINVQLGRELSLDLALAAGGVSEVVDVTATGSEAIDITSSKTVTNISEQFIENSPKGRNVHSILKVAPGVRFEPKAGNEGVGGISIDGASGAENAYIIDGVEVTDVRKGQLRRADSIPFEFVREVQVKSGGFEAEYGGATGGVVNVVTKSGSDDFHGEVAYSQTGSGLNSNTRGFWQATPSNAAVGEFFRQREDDYRASYPGFSLGGPIIKQRLNFFTSYFPEFIRTNRTLNLASGTQQTFEQKVTRHYGIARLDFAPTSKVQVNSSYLWTPTKVTGTLPVADDRVAPSPGLDKRGGYTPSNSFSSAVNYTPTSRLILSGRFGYKYLNDKGATLNGNYVATGGSYGISGSPFIFYRTGSGSQTNPEVPSEFAGANNFQNVASTLLTQKDITTRYNLYLDSTYVANFLGQQHTLKGGYSLNRLANDVEQNYTNGRFDIFWGEGFTRGTGIVNQRGTYGYYIWEDGVRLKGVTNSRNQGFYVQDSWQAHQRLTLNVGVRFENEFLPSFLGEINGVAQQPPISFGWGDKVAPRLGAAWDVLGNGRWKLSGSYGHYFDVMKYELARGSFGGDVWISHIYRLDNPAGFANLGFANPGAAGTLITEFDNRHIDVDENGQIAGIDPDLKPYQQREFTVTSEHQLGRETVLSMRYTRKRLIHAIEDIGLLDDLGNEVYVYGNPGFGTRSTSINTLSGEVIDLEPGNFLFPKAVREYDGFEVRFQHRFAQGFARGLSFLTSYTLSKLWGNYTGLANSDENGRSDPSVSRAFDLPYGNFDQFGHNVYGRLPTDRPHTFTFFGNYPLKWKGGTTDFSLSQVAYSGTPLSTEATVIVPLYPFGRGDLGRTDAFTQTDLLLAHNIPITERVNLKFEGNVTNLFNQAAVMNINNRINRSGNLSLEDPDFFNGFNILTAGLPANPVYGLPGTRAQGLTPNGSNAYQGIREVRLGVRLQF
jgi:outer membrane receptor protein involved in Fe transport